QGLGRLEDALPAVFRVGDAGGAAHEGDAAVVEVAQMRERERGRQIVIENDVGDALRGVVRGNGHAGYVGLDGGGRVEEQEAVDGALLQHVDVLFGELRVAEVAGGEVKIFGFEQVA